MELVSVTVTVFLPAVDISTVDMVYSEELRINTSSESSPVLTIA